MLTKSIVQVAVAVETGRGVGAIEDGTYNIHKNFRVSFTNVYSPLLL